MKSGFTLIELLIVISIIAVMAAISMVAYNSFSKNARDTRRQTDLRLIQSALEKYHADFKYYPTSLSNLTNYLSIIPSDPTTGNQYQYKSLNVDGTDCTDSTGCLRYRLYAKLENSSSGYNLEVPSPD